MEESKTTPPVNRENPVFGRKVFFVNPPLIVENIIVSELREAEYEVYQIDDYHYVKPVLEKNENAMLIIYIDDTLSYDQWFNFIKSIEVDEKLASIFTGVISQKATFEIKQRFLMDLKLPGGFFNLNEHIDKTGSKIKDILDLNGAKGRRQYIRLDCKNIDNSVTGYFAAKDKLFTFQVDNISSVGFACYYPHEIAVLFQKNSIIPGISLSIGRKTLVCPSVVFDTRINNGKGFSVLLFTKEVGSNIRAQIKEFVFEVLDSQFKEFVSNSIQDMTDYSEEIKVPETEIPQFKDIQDCFLETLEELKPEDEIL